MSNLLQIVTNLLFYALLQELRLNPYTSSFGDRRVISGDKNLIFVDEMVISSLFGVFWFQVGAEIRDPWNARSDPRLVLDFLNFSGPGPVRS